MCIYVYSKGAVNITTKNITLKVNSEIYDKYRYLCKKKGWVVSRQFEILMENTLREDE
tara:strand:- start:2680 stop:2853 length:174 start_codon:yes stop_codon:yes gene_type:complete